MANLLVVLYTALVWWCYLLCNISAATSMANETDRVALVAFKAAIDEDPFGALTSWNHSVHYCLWNGILCSRRHPDRVIGITLRSHGLVGSLSPHIGNLSFLKSLVLENNSFQGPIPPEMGRLFRLQIMALNNNSFGGAIPTNLSHCLSLQYLNLIDNNLTGNIPTELGSFPKLITLYLGKNKFSGTIPPSIGNLSSLSKLSCVYCNLHGEIPGEIARLRGLIFLQLSANNLSGKIPPGLYNISTIQYFGLALNQLHGIIPTDIGSSFPNLKMLYIFNNLFTGTIPTSLSNASGLERMSFSNNDFSGTMPRDLGKLLGLQWISVNLNRLQDDLTFISFLTNCTSLQLIEGSGNLLRGSLPDSVANLSTNLYLMNLENNQMHGNIPSGIGNLLNLTVLAMGRNYLTGPIPPSIGRLQNLHTLNLQLNKFTELPSSLGNLTLLNILRLGANNIHGSIPSSLGDCHSLLEFDLSENNLNGSIPPEIMSLPSISTLLRLSYNALTGSLPSEVSLTKLANMDVSYNRLSGPIPNTLSNCLSLEWLQLEANSFEGEIPQSLSMLRGLRMLDLSRNNLSGMIPSYLELLKATNGFSEANLVGVGSYASVYKGILDHVQVVVAVKVLNLQTRGASKGFISECKALREIRHRNLLKILSVCSSVDFHGNEFKALVYEFMANGNLDKWLHQVGMGDHGQLEESRRNLKLTQRLDIATDVASALEYLHCGCELTIIHGDLKPSNVLLDDQMTAHIGDFGLAKIISTFSSDVAQGQSNSVAIRGTIGYVAPEYGMGDMASTLGDVYSFGILLLEMFTGKRPIDDTFKDHLNLHNFVKDALPDRVMEIVDPYILLEHRTRSWIIDCMVSVLQIGVACSMESPRDRMKMGSVISELCKIKNTCMNEGLNQD
ncbi:putative receptor-like protein kinase At3g47110 isoform X2 [Camellia sinensis]|uniref:putative receptor-like protein kinase At3g47110 isoform X2 n=1 Tax=Camellia sinensis TaxID=4442 RepID=UPI00103573AD|nr:putative receptor-like protein kinase At3g47110 isoform X2 [Camellia sinensis]